MTGIENFKSARTTVYDSESVVIIGKYMDERNVNFSKTVNFLVHQADYLLRKSQLLREEIQELKGGINEKII